MDVFFYEREIDWQPKVMLTLHFLQNADGRSVLGVDYYIAQMESVRWPNAGGDGKAVVLNKEMVEAMYGAIIDFERARAAADEELADFKKLHPGDDPTAAEKKHAGKLAEANAKYDPVELKFQIALIFQIKHLLPRQLVMPHLIHRQTQFLMEYFRFKGDTDPPLARVYLQLIPGADGLAGYDYYLMPRKQLRFKANEGGRAAPKPSREI